jgi:hypothetical protein
MIEIVDTHPDLNVQLAEYTRLLGYPRGHELDGHAKELADAAREWFEKNARPWIYARQASNLRIWDDLITIDGQTFASKRLRDTLEQAEAHGAVMVAVSAGQEVEEQSQRLWREEKPDEYFFLEVFGSAVVEHLITMAGARLCAWADGQSMAVLPHYSPGYPEWDISQQPRLLDLILRGATAPFPGPLEVLESGMLRPKKSLLAVFGLTRQTSRVTKLTELNPCENCSYLSCTYRRAPYRRAPLPADLEIPAASPADRMHEIAGDPSSPSPGTPGEGRGGGLDEQRDQEKPHLEFPPAYTVNPKALARWAAERLTMSESADGSIDAVFRYEGTTCSNMGRTLRFDYALKLGAKENGYPILEQRCSPAAGDEGYKSMCRYLNVGDQLISAIAMEKPLLGHPLNVVLTWQRDTASAGCYCDPEGRTHKWGLVLQTVHYALAQREQPAR